MRQFPFPMPESYDLYGVPGGYDDPYSAGDLAWSPGEELERLTHLVLVDGRLVDVWSESVEGTRWQCHARRFDRERQPFLPPEPPEPPRPSYERVLEWLEVLVGGRDVLEGLSDRPLDPEGAELPIAGLGIKERHRLETAASQLERAGEEFPDEEMTVVLRRVLLAVWESEPEVILRARSASHTVAGICWTAGKANGAFGPQGSLTQAALRDALGLPCPLSSAGSPVRRALQGFLDVPARCPAEAPDLLLLGRADLLTSSTRRMLLRLRDRARDAERVHAPPGGLP